MLIGRYTQAYNVVPPPLATPSDRQKKWLSHLREPPGAAFAAEGQQGRVRSSHAWYATRFHARDPDAGGCSRVRGQASSGTRTPIHLAVPKVAGSRPGAKLERHLAGLEAHPRVEERRRGVQTLCAHQGPADCSLEPFGQVLVCWVARTARGRGVADIPARWPCGALSGDGERGEDRRLPVLWSMPWPGVGNLEIREIKVILEAYETVMEGMGFRHGLD